ncbi:glyoxalase [Pueribacillus theae]|uniref:Glyoxalase n=2 Tax=Pueribacillus theae TaxID=2171751 RepID=A0A2U1K7J6_9BACI|nr:glyoxalase [Pueribacillus theae]
MVNKPIRDCFHTVTPYLIVQGADKLIDFLIKAFEARELNRTTDSDGFIRHAEVKLGDSIIECSERREQYPPMQNAIHLYVSDTDESYRRALDAGATSLYEPEDMPYGERSAGVKDPFGNHWYIATWLGTDK